VVAAQAIGALVRAAAGAALLDQAARPVHAGVGVGAVGVRRARIDAHQGGRIATSRRAPLIARRDALAGAVATGRRRQRGGGRPPQLAASRLADGRVGVQRALARRAHAGRAAGALRRGGADPLRVGAALHVGAGAGGRGEVAGRARARAGLVAALALRAVRAGALVVAGAVGAARLGTARADVPVLAAAVRRDALLVAGAGAVALVGVAVIRVAGQRRRPQALARGVAGGRSGVDVVGAVLERAGGADGIALAAAVPVALAVRTAGLSAEIHAHLARVGRTGGHVGALADAVAQAAAAAGARAGAVTADAVDAVAVLALAVGLAGLAVGLGAAALVDAGGVVGAVDRLGRGRARRRAGAVRAPVGRAGVSLGRLAGPLAVAGGRRLQRVARAGGGRPAGRVGGELRAAAEAIAKASGAAGGGILYRAQGVRLILRRGRAGPHVADHGAAPAGAGARDVAAAAVGAVTGGAVAVGLARGGQHLQTTASVAARLPRHAVRVGRTFIEAGHGRAVAREGRTDRGRGGLAGAAAVALIAAGDGVARATASLAGRACRVALALARAVAHAVLAAGGSVGLGAVGGGARGAACRDGPARAQR